MNSAEYTTYLERVKILRLLETRHATANTFDRIQLNEDITNEKNTINKLIADHPNLQNEINEQIKFNYINPIAKAIMGHAERLQKKIGEDLPDIIKKRDLLLIKIIALSKDFQKSKQRENMNAILIRYYRFMRF